MYSINYSTTYCQHKPNARKIIHQQLSSILNLNNQSNDSFVQSFISLACPNLPNKHLAHVICI